MALEFPEAYLIAGQMKQVLMNRTICRVDIRDTNAAA